MVDYRIGSRNRAQGSSAGMRGGATGRGGYTRAGRSYLSHTREDRSRAVQQTRRSEGSSRRWQGLSQGTAGLKNHEKRRGGMGTTGIPAIKSAPKAPGVDAALTDETLAYPTGSGISHPDLGLGYVIESRKDAQGRELVKVRFDSGQTKMFFAGYAPIERIIRKD